MTPLIAVKIEIIENRIILEIEVWLQQILAADLHFFVYFLVVYARSADALVVVVNVYHFYILIRLLQIASEPLHFLPLDFLFNVLLKCLLDVILYPLLNQLFLRIS